MKEKTFDAYVAAATRAPDAEVHSVQRLLYPHYIRTVSAAFRAVVHCPAGTHCVVTSFLRDADGEPQYHIWCADAFLEAKNLTHPEARERAVEAAGDPSHKTLISELMKEYGSAKRKLTHGRCDFWATWRRDRKLCPHTSGLLAHLRDNVPDFKPLLMQAYDSAVELQRSGCRAHA